MSEIIMKILTFSILCIFLGSSFCCATSNNESNLIINLTQKDLDLINNIVDNIEDDELRTEVEILIDQIITNGNEINMEELPSILNIDYDDISNVLDPIPDNSPGAIIDGRGSMQYPNTTGMSPIAIGFFPPFDDEYVYIDENGVADAAGGANRFSGAIGSVACAFAGGSAGEAGQIINFYVGRTKTVTIEGDFGLTYGTASIGFGSSATFTTCHMDDWDNYDDELLEFGFGYDSAEDIVLFIVSLVTGLPFGDIYSAIEAVIEIQDYLQWYQAMSDLVDSGDAHWRGSSFDFVVEPGWHQIWFGTKSVAVGLAGEGQALSCGILDVITIQGIGEPDPPIINGPDSGYTDVAYSFSAIGTDFNEDPIQYKFIWGDDEETEWSEFVPSGTEITMEHTYDNPDSYEIEVITRDIDLIESDPSYHWISIESISPFVPDVQTLSATGVGETSAHLNGKILDDGGEPCQIRFQIKEDGGSPWFLSDWHGSYETDDTFLDDIENLDPDTHYYFKAGARNSAGEDWGSWVDFTTQEPGIQPPDVQTLDASGVGETTATLQGKILDDGGENCQVGFKYRRVGEGDWTFTGWEGSHSTNDQFSKTVSNLESGTGYEFKACAKNSAGEDWGTIKEFTTQVPSGNHPPEKPSIPDGEDVLNKGDVGEFEMVSVDPDGDLIQYRLDLGDGTFSEWTKLDSSGHIGVISNIWYNPGSYIIKAQARDQYFFESEWSDAKEITVVGDDSWTMSGHDPKHTCYSSYNGSSSNYVYWSYDPYTFFKSPPLVNNGKVYTVGNGDANINAGYFSFDADPSDGQDEGIDDSSSSSYDRINELLNEEGVDERDDAIFYDGKIYYMQTSSSQVDSGLVCIDADSFEEQWTFDWSYRGKPVAYNGKIYFFNSYDSIACLDALSGNFIWNHNLDDLSDNLYPAVDNNKVYIVCENKIICLDAIGNGDGTTNEIWNHNFGTLISTPPTIYDGKLYCSSWDSEKLYCLDTSGNGDGTTSMIWQYNNIAVRAGGCIGAAFNNIYMLSIPYSDISKVVCLDANGNGDGTTTLIWSYQFPPHFDGGTNALALSYDKIYISNSGKIFCFDRMGNGDGTTTKLWEYDSHGKTTFYELSVYEDMLFASSYDRIYCFKDIEGGHRPDIPLLDGPESGGLIPHLFYAVAYDSDGDDIKYRWDWGNGIITDFGSAHPSGEEISKLHSWLIPGEYRVRVQAYSDDTSDSNLKYSDWSKTIDWPSGILIIPGGDITETDIEENMEIDISEEISSEILQQDGFHLDQI